MRLFDLPCSPEPQRHRLRDDFVGCFPSHADAHTPASTLVVRCTNRIMVLSRRSFLSAAAVVTDSFPTFSVGQDVHWKEPFTWGWGKAIDSNSHRWPVARFIVKLALHAELNDRLPVETHERLLIRNLEGREEHMTEKEYLRFLYEEGRCNIAEQDHRRIVVGVLGRRSGKIDVATLLSMLATEQLLRRSEPGVVQYISANRDQASTKFRDLDWELRADADLSARYNYPKSLLNERLLGQSPFQFRFGVERAQVRVKQNSYAAKGIRPAHTVIMDDVTLYADGYARRLYENQSPHVRAVGGHMVMMACPTPWPQDTFMHELVNRGMAGDPDLLVLRIPTWEGNPLMPIKFFQDCRTSRPDSFVELGCDLRAV